MTRFILSICITPVLVAAALSTAPAEDAWITAAYQPVTGGYRYYITVYNNMAAATGNHVYSLKAYGIGADADPVYGWDLESPPKFDRTTIQLWGVAWSTGGAAEGWTGHWYDGVPPGDSLSGFNVTTSQLIAGLRYDLAWFDGTSMGNLFNGYTQPVLVPEPSALLALAGGLGVLGLPFIRRRR